MINDDLNPSPARKGEPIKVCILHTLLDLHIWNEEKGIDPFFPSKESWCAWDDKSRVGEIFPHSKFMGLMFPIHTFLGSLFLADERFKSSWIVLGHLVFYRYLWSCERCLMYSSKWFVEDVLYTMIIKICEGHLTHGEERFIRANWLMHDERIGCDAWLTRNEQIRQNSSLHEGKEIAENRIN